MQEKLLYGKSKLEQNAKNEKKRADKHQVITDERVYFTYFLFFIHA